jgi:hypothetical protein
VKVGIFILTLLFSLLFCSISSAATHYSVDLDAIKGMSDEAKAEYLKGLVKQYVDNKENTSSIPKVSSTEAKEWATLISGAIKTICIDLSVSVNEFLKTDAGKITTFLIAYKIIGQDIKDIVFGTSAWFVITLILLISFWLIIIPKRIIVPGSDKRNPDVIYKPRLDFSKEARGIMASIIAAMFIVITVVCLVLVF